MQKKTNSESHPKPQLLCTFFQKKTRNFPPETKLPPFKNKNEENECKNHGLRLMSQGLETFI